MNIEFIRNTYFQNESRKIGEILYNVDEQEARFIIGLKAAKEYKQVQKPRKKRVQRKHKSVS